MTGSPWILWLASASARRAMLLKEAGFDARCEAPDLDDAVLAPHESTPLNWVLAMAWFKAARVRARLPGEASAGLLIAADTVCACDGQIIGKPADQEVARRVLRRLAGRAHQVHTGVCLIDLPSGTQTLLLDTATVTLGALDDATIDRYLATGAWRDKAGGYNYGDRLADGWPLSCEGDPTSVMGLPMRRLVPILHANRGARSGAHRAMGERSAS